MPETPRTPVFPRLPAPGPRQVPDDRTLAIWWTPVDVPGDAITALRADLDPATVGRVDAMVREIDRRRTILAHGLLRHLVSAVTGDAPPAIALTRRCETCGAIDHGKPALADRADGTAPPLQFNLAHSGPVVAVALAGPGTPVGVDVEAVDPDFDWEPTRHHVFSGEEWTRTEYAPDPATERFALWARKEAAVKATGHGLQVELARVGVQPQPGGDGAYRAGLAAPDGEHALLISDLTLAPGTVAAVAVPDRGTAPRITVTCAGPATSTGFGTESNR